MTPRPATRWRPATGQRLAARLVCALFAAGLLSAAPLAPVAAEPPVIRFEAGADVLTLDRSAIESAEIPDGHTAYVSGHQDLVPLLIRFTPDVSRALEEMTARHVGETVFILIDGALVSRPVVREAISSGGVIITNLDRNVAAAVISAVQAPAAQ